MTDAATTPISSPTTSNLPPLLTVEECAQLARTSVSSVRSWIASQRLKSVRPGRRRLVRRADLLAFLGLTADEAR